MTDVLASARAFKDELRKRADEIERGRRLPADIAARFAAAGFYRQCVPEIYGGLEAEPATLARVIEAIAEGDGSAAWCIMIGATMGLTAAYLPKATADEVYTANPNVILAGVFAPRGKAETVAGGYRVNGRWQWGSNSPSASWIMGGCLVTREGKLEALANGAPNPRMMLVPTTEAKLMDNWDVSGLSGTGSQDFVFDNLFVPEGRGVALITDKPLARPLYTFPVFGLLATGIAAVTLGLARAAIDELVALASGKTPEGHRKPLAQRARTQEDVAEAEAVLRAARAFFYEAIDAAFDDAKRDMRIRIERRRDLRLAATHAVRSAARAVDLMYNLGGGTSVYKTSPLQRIFRDVHVATQHMMVAPPTMETVGRLFLGLETDISQL
jgi:alkylation response protein AidB-like acyl-CoA dehydrogenase